MSAIVIIVASHRKNGNTAKLVSNLQNLLDCDVIDLLDYNISRYDYHNANRNDDFIPLMRRIVRDYQTFVFATPVYWYSVSGLLKTFLDRITDLLTIEKELGRQLRGKSMATVTVSGGGHLGDAFFLPLRATTDYLGMSYLADLHTLDAEPNSDALRQFADRITFSNT